METSGIRIGNEPNTDQVSAVATALKEIMVVGEETHMDQETVRDAFHTLSQLSSIRNINVAGNKIDMGANN